MTPQEQIAQLQRKVQSQKNANAALNVRCDGLAAKIKVMDVDLEGQRYAMQVAIEHINNRDHKAAKAMLTSVLVYRENQREQRKGRVA